jgi:3-dehydroquinate synthetase
MEALQEGQRQILSRLDAMQQHTSDRFDAMQQNAMQQMFNARFDRLQLAIWSIGGGVIVALIGLLITQIIKGS